MATPTGRAPQQGDLLSLAVGQPVSRSHGLRMVGDLSFLLGWAGAHPIAHVRSDGTPEAGTMPIIYARNPGVQAIEVSISVSTDTSGGTGTLAVTASSGTITWLAQNGIDGTTALVGYFNDTIQQTVYSGTIDVSALTVGTPIELRFTAASLGANSFGISHVDVIEVPTAAADPVGDPADERGLDAAWPSVNGRLVDGDATTSPRGFVRAIGELDKARAGVKRHLQAATNDNANQAWVTSGGTLFTFPLPRVRARRLYTTSVDNAYTALVTYRTSNGSTAGEATFTDGTNTTVVTLPASTTRTTVTAAFEIITSGTNQEADITISYQRTSGAGQLLISNFCLLENES